jgi:hypothetical protein
MEMEKVELTETQAKARRGRNVALAAVLGGLCILFYVVTVAKYFG